MKSRLPIIIALTIVAILIYKFGAVLFFKIKTFFLKKDKLTEDKESLLSKVFDWIPFKPTEYLSTYFNETSAKIIIWTLVVLAVIWIVKTIYRTVKKQSPVISFGYSGGWLIFLIGALIFYIFIVEAFPGDKNEEVKVEKIDTVSIFLTNQPITVTLASYNSVIPIHIRARAPSDGKTTYVVCAEIVGPESLVGLENFPSEHVEYLNPNNTGYRYDLGITKDVKHFFIKEGIISKLEVLLIMKEANYWGTNTGNICPHSTY